VLILARRRTGKDLPVRQMETSSENEEFRFKNDFKSGRFWIGLPGESKIPEMQYNVSYPIIL
jgi:hypothetical protein